MGSKMSGENRPDPTAAVRQELQAAYARAGKAYMAKDAATLMGMVTPNFLQTMPDGQTLAYPDAGTLLNEWFATTDAVTRYEVEIGDLAVQGDRAVAEVVERVATRFVDPGGGPHERVQKNTARVTWVRADVLPGANGGGVAAEPPGAYPRSSQGWQIERSDYRSGEMTVDGKPVAAGA